MRKNAFVLILTTLLVLVFPSAMAQLVEGYGLQVKSDRVDENYLIGYLTWNLLKGGIAWTPEAKTEDPGVSTHTGRGAKAAVGWNLRTNTNESSAAGQELLPSEFFVSDPVPVTLFVNVSRVIQVDFYLASPTGFDVELYLDEGFIGGQLHGFNIQTSAWPPYRDGFSPAPYRFYSEVDRIPAGSRLIIKLVFSGMSSDEVRFGLKGGHQSVIRIPYYPLEEAIFRIPEYALEPSALATGNHPTSEQHGDGFTLRSGSLSTIFLMLGAAGAGRVRQTRTRILAMVLLLIASSSGCLDSGAVRSTKQEIQDDPENVQSVVDESGFFVRNGTGSLAGLVRDEGYAAVVGANVTVVGWGVNTLSTHTALHGGFAFKGLPSGELDLSVEKAGYHAYAAKVVVQTGQITRVEVVMRSLDASGTQDGGLAPHRHDYWGGTSSRVLMDDDVSWGVGGTSISSCLSSPLEVLFYWPIFTKQAICTKYYEPPLLEGGTPPIVLPGTYEVEVSVAWPEDENRVDRVGVGFLANHDTNRTFMYPKANGEVTRFRTSWEMTDNGHVNHSSWAFFLYIPNNAGGWDSRGDFNPSYSAQTYLAPFRVKLTLLKGVVPLEPAHRDFWKSGSFVTAKDSICERGPYGSTGSGSGYDCDWIPSDVVPPGTIRLAVRINQSQAIWGEDWNLFYKPSNRQVDYWGGRTSFKEAELVSTSALERTYTIRNISAEETDKHYQTRSNWVFYHEYAGPRGGTTLNPPRVEFWLNIVAYADS